jgi:hypothetical protein
MKIIIINLDTKEEREKGERREVGVWSKGGRK